jgi:hypothetical protein
MSAARIAELNDLARTAMGVASRLAMTSGIRALSPADQSAIRERVETFNDFSKDNDPYGERDFGSFIYNPNADICEKVFWKIDYYDKKDSDYGSEDPSDPSQTTRVLTIMLAEEY